MRRPRGGVWPTAKLPRAQNKIPERHHHRHDVPLTPTALMGADGTGRIDCARAGVRRSRTAASAKKRAKVVQLSLELLFCWRNFTSAKVVQLSLELLFCWRNFTSAKVVQLLLKLLVVLIACPCSGADRRPARSGPRPRRREAKAIICALDARIVAAPAQA